MPNPIQVSAVSWPKPAIAETAQIPSRPTMKVGMVFPCPLISHEFSMATSAIENPINTSIEIGSGR